jgi:hypothetical protein
LINNIMEKEDKKLNSVAKELYDLVSTQFVDLKLGDDSATVVTEPEYARFFDFTYGVDGSKLGKVSISLDEKAVSVIYKKNFVANQPENVKKLWYDFLRKIRKIANINRLTFDVRDIDKNNLTKRDYQVMSSEKFKGNAMTESKFYGTSMKSYLNIGEARLVIKHSQPVNQEIPGGRSQHIESIYVESNQGERFKYPIKHLNGAKAMARHVSEGGNPYDDFGNHIVGLSEELGKLGKFKRYMGRGGVMAESLGQYVDAVNERIADVRSRVEKLQRETFYREAFGSFETTVLEEVPSDVAENWIEELTIRQFNEELKDVFPYIYRIVSERSKPKLLGPEDLVSEADNPCWKGYKQLGMKEKNGREVPNCVPESEELEENDRYRSNKKFKVADPDYNNFTIYVSQEKILQNQFMAVAVSNASGREAEGSKILSNKPDKAVELVRQKLDDRMTSSKKVTGDATLDFNVAFTHDFMTNDADDLGIDDPKKFYAKIAPGPVLVVANMYEFGEMTELLTADGFSRAGVRNSGPNPLLGVKLSSKRVQLAELVANGRYIIGKPTQNKDGHYEYPMKFDSVVMDKGDLLKFNVPAVTVGSSRTESSFESQIDDYFENLMGQFSNKQINEAGTSAFVRFVERDGAAVGGNEKTRMLNMIVGFGNNPSELKYTNAEVKYSVKSFEDIDRYVKRLLSKESMMGIESIILVDETNEKGMWGLTAKYPFLRDFFEKAEAEQNPKIQVQAKDRRDPTANDKVKVISKKKDSKGTWANPDARVEPPKQTKMYYVTVENPRLMDFLHRKKPEFMQQHWRPNIKRFIMNKKQLDSFKAMVDTPDAIRKFGKTTVWEFDPRNFKEEFDTPVDEGIRDKLKVMALIGMAGMGGNMALDAVSAKNSPLGKALAVAAQQGDQKAAIHLKKLDSYIDGNDTRTLSGLRQTYMGKSAFENQEADECGPGDDMPKPEKPKSPIGDFILSFYDRNTGQFPKGETAVLTMVEKDYGDHYVPMATEFINRIHSTFEQFSISENPEIARIRSLAGL